LVQGVAWVACRSHRFGRSQGNAGARVTSSLMLRHAVELIQLLRSTRAFSHSSHPSQLAHETLFVLVGGPDERREQRVRASRLRLELGVKLHGNVPRVAGELRNLHELAVGRSSRDAQTAIGERLLVETVEFVPMTVA